jgi:hypothetical protein
VHQLVNKKALVVLSKWPNLVTCLTIASIPA